MHGKHTAEGIDYKELKTPVGLFNFANPLSYFVLGDDSSTLKLPKAQGACRPDEELYLNGTFRFVILEASLTRHRTLDFSFTDLALTTVNFFF